jgi:chromosomal replication initiator protein
MLAWDEFLTQLEQDFGREIINQWVKPLRVVKFDAANLYLEAESSFQVHWFEEHIRPRLKKGFANNNLRPIVVHLQAAREKMAQKPAPGARSLAFEIKQDLLEIDFIFEHFLPSENNLIPYRLLKELDSPSLALGTFNPLFIYGPHHSGKTHLLMAAAKTLQQKKKVFFVKAETFTEHVVQAIRSGSMQSFRQTYRDIDVLIIDDVHIFARKNATQEEFFHTFNTLHTSGKQIILSANTAPSQLNEIEPRLISRFEWGLSAGLEPAPQKKQILELKAQLWHLSIHPEVFDFLLEEIPSQPIEALQALALRVDQAPIDPSIARQILKDFLSREQELTITPQYIIQKISEHFGIKSEDILGKSQMREFALPRQIAMYSCREKLKMPFQAIGELFGRDHSTVMSSVKQIQKGIEEKRQDLIEAMRSCKK